MTPEEIFAREIVEDFCAGPGDLVRLQQKIAAALSDVMLIWQERCRAYVADLAVERQRAETAERDNKLLKQIIDDSFSDVCLPTCDSYAHDEDCPATFGRPALQRLTAKLAAQGEALRRLASAYHHEMHRTSRMTFEECSSPVCSEARAALRATPAPPAPVEE